MSTARGAVVSVRLSEQEQIRLRKLAEERGTSLSELIRSYVSDKIGPQIPRDASVSASPSSRSTQVGEGVFWQTSGPGVVASGTTLTVHPNSSTHPRS